MINPQSQTRPGLRPSVGSGEMPTRPKAFRESESKGNGTNGDYSSHVLRLREEAITPVGRVEGHEASSAPVVTAEDDLAVMVHELRLENDRLHQLLEQARQRLVQLERGTEQWQAREQEYESLLEEKSELIRQLHAELQAVGNRTGPAVPNEEELIALHQELEREREQLKQDEEALMGQIREIEVQMSRERADMARQRSELQRLQNELKHQLEIASRDAALRERLAPLYRLQEDIQRRRAPGK